MKLKKLLAVATSAALALTTMAIAPLTASAADSVDTVPSGTETVLATFKFDGADYSGSYSGTWNNVGTIDSGLSGDSLTSYMTDADVYIKVSASSVGTYTTGDNGENQTSLEELVTWDGYSGWVTIAKMYRNWGDNQFEVTFAPASSSTSSHAVAYVPIAKFGLDEYNQLQGNFQTGGFSTVTIDSVQLVKFGDSDPTPAGSDLAYKFPTGPISFTINDARGWGDAGTTKAAQGMDPISAPTGVTYGKTTIAELLKMYSTISLNGVQYKNDDLNAGADKFSLSLYIQHGSGWDWKSYSVGTLASPSASVKIADILGSYNEDDVIQTIGLQINCKGGDVPAIESMDLGDTFYLNRASTPASATVTVTPSSAAIKVGEKATLTATASDGSEITDWSSSDDTVATVTNGVVTGVKAGKAIITAKTATASGTATVTVTDSSAPVDPVDPVVPTDGTIWSGSEDLRTDWSTSVSIPAEKFADIKADDTLVFTFTKGSADYFQIKIMDGDWTPLASPKTNEWDCVELSDSPYEVKISAADASALKSKGMVISGYGVVLKSVAVKSAGGSDEPSETVTVTISSPVNSIEVGNTAVLTATVSNGAAITAWKSSDESVVSVENGIITGKKAGTAVITAFCGDAYAEFTVTVTAPAVTPVVPSIWDSIFTNVPSVPGTASLSETEKAANKLKFGSDVSFIPENNTIDADLIMALLKSKNKLKANMGSYAFTFDGSKPNDLFDLTGDIDLGISYMSVPTDIMEMFPNADKIIVFRTNYSGQLPTEVILSMNAGKEFFKKNASLFCIDDEVEFISSGKIKANGMVDVPGLTHFSTYAVVVGNTASSNVVYENVDSAQGIALETETASHSVLPVIAVIAASAAAVFAVAVTVKKLRNSR